MVAARRISKRFFLVPKYRARFPCRWDMWASRCSTETRSRNRWRPEGVAAFRRSFSWRGSSTLIAILRPWSSCLDVVHCARRWHPAQSLARKDTVLPSCRGRVFPAGHVIVLARRSMSKSRLVNMWGLSVLDERQGLHTISVPRSSSLSTVELDM